MGYLRAAADSDRSRGVMTDLDGRPLDYNRPDVYHHRGLVASNGLIHAMLLELVRKFVEEDEETRRRGDAETRRMSPMSPMSPMSLIGPIDLMSLIFHHSSFIIHHSSFLFHRLGMIMIEKVLDGLKIQPEGDGHDALVGHFPVFNLGRTDDIQQGSTDKGIGHGRILEVAAVAQAQPATCSRILSRASASALATASRRAGPGSFAC